MPASLAEIEIHHGISELRCPITGIHVIAPETGFEPKGSHSPHLRFFVDWIGEVWAADPEDLPDHQAQYQREIIRIFTNPPEEDNQNALIAKCIEVLPKSALILEILDPPRASFDGDICYACFELGEGADAEKISLSSIGEFSKYIEGDECPFCMSFNSPPSGDLCEHAAAWSCDGELEALAEGEALNLALRDLEELLEFEDEGSPIRTMLEAQARRSPARQNLIDSASLTFEEALETLSSAQSGDGWQPNGALGGVDYTIYVPDLSSLRNLTSECRKILNACALKIQTETSAGANLEARCPEGSVQWKFVASGFWSEDGYHSGHIAYYIANPAPGCWVMEARERNAILDDVTEEDIEEERLNDEQLQAIWGQTLEEAQSAAHSQIVAWSEGGDPDCTAEEMASVLYRAVCEDGGKQITDWDDVDGLLET